MALPLEIVSSPQFYRSLQKEKARREASRDLHAFTMAAWNVIEPGTPFVDGWHLRAISEHLEAVTNGEIRNLLINIPPRHMKSIQGAVMWPVYTWIERPEFRWLFASYAGSLSVRDSLKCRRLIESPWFQDLWGDRFSLTGDQNAKTFFENDHYGYRFATSVGASTTGHGGDALVCFPAEQIIHTERGPMKIGDVVEDRVSVRVPSYNGHCAIVEYKEITGWHRNPPSDIVHVILEDGRSFRCTPEHRIMTAKGWVEARHTQGLLAATLQPLGGLPPATTTPDGVDERGLDSEGCRNIGSLASIDENQAGGIVGEDCSGLPRSRIAKMLDPVFDVLLPRSVRQVTKGAVAWVTVQMTNIVTFGAWTDERKRHKDVDFTVEGLPSFTQNDPRVAVGVPAPHQPAALHGEDAALVGDKVLLVPDNVSPDFVRVAAVVASGRADVTYCISVQHNRSFVVGAGVIVSNCDDPHNAMEAQSDTMRESTLEWWDQAMSTRLNNPKTGSKVIIMQRLHEKDLAGHVLSQGNWEHLCLPAEFERSRVSVTSLGFKDPRKEEGELLWPDRFGRPELEQLKLQLGEYGTSGQLQQRPSPAEGGLIKRGWFRVLEPDKQLPKLMYVLQSYDTAFTEKTSNDPTAQITWGIVNTPKGRGALILDAWTDHLTYPDLRKKMWDEYRSVYGPHDKAVDAVLIEEKGSGISLVQDLRRSGVPVHTYNPGRADKTTRLHSVAPLLEAGVVYFPSSKKRNGGPPTWCDELIRQLLAFPNAEHDDLVDAFTQALIYLRDSGMLSIDSHKFPEDEAPPRGERENPYAV